LLVLTITPWTRRQLAHRLARVVQAMPGRVSDRARRAASLRRGVVGSCPGLIGGGPRACRSLICCAPGLVGGGPRARRSLIRRVSGLVGGIPRRVLGIRRGPLGLRHRLLRLSLATGEDENAEEEDEGNAHREWPPGLFEAYHDEMARMRGFCVTGVRTQSAERVSRRAGGTPSGA
jgi:hypothetical protein